jgi:hypothetical protein
MTLASSESADFLNLGEIFLIMKGAEYDYQWSLFLVTSIDLSNNNLIGEIHEELTIFMVYDS